ncbi:MAG TPA: type II toxin-antitoxin system VapC family toxin [Thermoanaerobaculia bacterium]
MNLYAESSAVLAWLFEERTADDVEAAFNAAEIVVASDLTLVECDRALIRARATGELSEFEANRRRTILEASSSYWTFIKIDREVLERARHRFPGEPLRTLDALHVASALAARSVVPDLALLSLDGRVRENCAALGFDVLPVSS